MTNSKCRASLFGIGSDTTSFWNLQSNFFLTWNTVKTWKTIEVHTTLDSQLVFDNCFNKQIYFLKNVLATFYRSDKFKSFHTFLKAFELIRSTKGSQSLFRKHDLLHTISRKQWHVSNTVKNTFSSIHSYVNKSAEFKSAVRFGWNILKWWVVDD